MAEAHGGLGELLVVLYLGVAIGSFLLAKRRGLPPWLTGTAHALLGVQIILGIILYARNTELVPVTHVIAGLATIPALALIVPLRPRLGRGRAVGIAALVVAILAAIAVIIAMTR